MYKFVYIVSKDPIDFYQSGVIEIFQAISSINKVVVTKKTATLYFSNALELSIEEIANILNTDLYLKLTIFESDHYNHLTDLKEDLKKVAIKLDNKPFSYDNFYYNYIDLVYDEIKKPLSEAIKKRILKSYYNDQEMYKVLETFFNNNSNTSTAAKELYLHRNTLIQKIDKFHEVTGYNPKNFKDAVIIYQVIKNNK